MKEEELQVEETDFSDTLGGAGEVTRGEERGERRGCRYYSAVIHTFCLLGELEHLKIKSLL
jgi:hypothetical protein